MTRWQIFAFVFLALHLIGAFIFGPLPVAEIAIVEAAIVSWTYVFLYSRTYWRDTAVGVQIMCMAVFLALLTTLSLVPESLGFDGVLRAWVSFVVLVALPLLMLNMVRVLRIAQRYAREEEQSHGYSE